MRSKPVNFDDCKVQFIKGTLEDASLVLAYAESDLNSLTKPLTELIFYNKFLNKKNPITSHRVEEIKKELCSFKIPVFEKDKTLKVIPGNNLSVYRKVENNGKTYFDSFVPLNKFNYRGKTPANYMDIFLMTDQEEKRIVDFTNKEDNFFVGINRIETDFKNYLMIRMDCLGEEYSPIVAETTSFTETSLAQKQAKRFNMITSRIDLIQKVYDACFDSIISLPQNTGFKLTDVSLNNIVADQTMSNIKLIDYVDIKKTREKQIFDMSKVFSITRERLDKEFVDNLTEDSLKFFPTYESRKDKIKNRENEEFSNRLFKKISRQRYINCY